MLAHMLNMVCTQTPVKTYDSTTNTMSYASTTAQHGPYTQPLLKRMIALLPSTMPCANTYVQHGLYILTPVKTYDSTTTYYYVIC